MSAPFASLTAPVRVPLPDWATTGTPANKPTTVNSQTAKRHGLCAVRFRCFIV